MPIGISAAPKNRITTPIVAGSAPEAALSAPLQFVRGSTSREEANSNGYERILPGQVRALRGKPEITRRIHQPAERVMRRNAEIVLGEMP
jgi:hypothetical protein